MFGGGGSTYRVVSKASIACGGADMVLSIGDMTLGSGADTMAYYSFQKVFFQFLSDRKSFLKG